MTLLEYAEKVSSEPLSEWQKRFFVAYEQAEKENEEFFISFPRNVWKTLALQIINGWKRSQQLQEYRCNNCKRLLGKFSGRAEVKCPKCGKINMI